jgi:putative ABC transport system substrate-binding protein
LVVYCKTTGVAQGSRSTDPPIDVQVPDDLSRGFEALAKARVDALTVLLDPFIMNHYQRIVQLAAVNHLPGVYEREEFVEAGGPMSYGASLEYLFRRAAIYVDRILKGAKPDLPVERPMQAEFVINLKTANAIGINIPPEMLQPADKVIK